ncbi:alpha/beta fold hydrolase [Flavobacterium hauense]
MKTALHLLALIFCLHLSAQTVIQYGDNKEVGKYITLNGVKHYYETYGEGEPLLLIHGNSTGIKGWAPQIEFFSKKYKVYAIDCRGRGKSDLGKDTLSYSQQANDMAVFIRQMKLESVSVIGKSDGGIIGIMMGMYQPEHLKKIVAFSANMQPDGLYPEGITEIKAERLNAEKMLAAKDTSKDWELERQKNRMMEFQPHITAEDLQKIKIPVLVISTDRDVIKEEHTLFIYKNIPNANLAIISGEGHRVPRQNPEPFNVAVDKFLSEPFKEYEYRFKK